MEPTISCTGISKSFGGVPALRGVRLDLYPGEIHALIGENGAGKSTLIKILAGIYVRDGGTVLFQGREAALGSIEAARELGIAVIHQELSVVKALTAPQNVFLGQERQKGKLIRMLDPRRMLEETQALFSSLGVQIPLDVPAKDLSIAQCQLIEIAKALRVRAKVLVLDEPTTGLHFEDVRQLLIVLQRLVDAGNTVLVIEHNLDVIKCADRIVDLGPEGGERGGTVVAQGTPEEVAQVEGSYTGAFVKKMLEDGRL